MKGAHQCGSLTLGEEEHAKIRQGQQAMQCAEGGLNQDLKFDSWPDLIGKVPARLQLSSVSNGVTTGNQSQWMDQRTSES